MTFCLTVSSNATELVGYIVLPADTFSEGPPSGQFDSAGKKADRPRFSNQPVQGFSAIQFAPECGQYYVMADNGFGTKLNSIDYLLRIYQITPGFSNRINQEGSVTVENFIQLRDPDQLIPFPIVNEQTEDRLLTGYDFDIESFVIDANGDFWLGDEFGPYLLKFDQTGRLLKAPIAIPSWDVENPVLQSPNHPAVFDQQLVTTDSSHINVKSSRGFEGMAISPNKTKIYPMLEGPLPVDPNDLVRIYEFDLETLQFSRDGMRQYQLSDPDFAIGDMAVINEHEYLIIERDRNEGDQAQFKKVFKIDFRKQTDDVLDKQPIADLMNIADPNNIAGFGELFQFPFITIENLLVVDTNTILVANDNNYDGTGGRGADKKDDNEFIMLSLDTPLSLDPRVGISTHCKKTD